MSNVIVIGAGPAGCVFSARMAQLGHSVTLVEGMAFPRMRLGESLSPGVLPLLEMIGARQLVEGAGFSPVQAVTTTWDGDVQERRDPDQRGLLVDRGRFDGLLLERARVLGVRVLQPAIVREGRPGGNGWHVRVESPDGYIDLDADFVADATGRSGTLSRLKPGPTNVVTRARHDVSTIALYAYWTGATLPSQPRIEAGRDAWYWGVPIPGGLYNTLVFLDASRVREHRGQPIETLFHEYIDRSGLMAACVDARRASPVRATDATPYIDNECLTPSMIKVGDAALALDPLSSSGVQKAIQTALSAAVVANTLLQRPASAREAMQFYQTTITRAADRHRGWAASQYARVAARGNGAFWDARAVGAVADLPAQEETRPSPESFGDAVELSPLLEFVDVPCIDGEFVTTKPAVAHPELEEPLAYLGSWELRPLLDTITSGMTPLEIARGWSDRMPIQSALKIAGWLLERRILVYSSSRRLP